MKTNQTDLDRLFSKILNEEINNKVSILMEKKFGDGRDNIDVAEPKGKITGADFAELRSMKKKKKSTEIEEGGGFGGFTSPSDEMSNWDEERWNEEMEKAERRAKEDEEMGKRMKMDEPEEKPSFWKRLKKKFTNEDSDVCEQCGASMKEGECMECGTMYEAETEEGNLFTDKLRKTKKGGKFKIGNKTYTDNSNLDESYNTFEFTESEMINLIENIVKEEKEKKNQEIKVQKVTNKLKDTLTKKYVSGLAKTKKAQDSSKKENDDYISSVTKKMKEYLKQGSKTGYDMNPKQFPKGNGELGEMSKKAYKASDAVEEYIEAFAYPGLELTHFDEIKPNEEWMESNIKGSSKTGNNPQWANAVETELGEKMNDKRKKALYDIEKHKGSYKRVKQPIDQAGETKEENSLDSMFAKLESVDDKKTQKLSEEFKKMKDLITYNKKTQ